MSDPILEVNNLHVQFETHEGIAKVIDGVDLSIERGKTVAIVGETGCGKSVTVKTILGLLPEASVPEGEILYEGEDLLSMSEAELNTLRGGQMSMIMQNPMSSLNPVFTIGEQMIDQMKWGSQRRLGIGEWLRDKFRDDSEYRERAVSMLEKVEIPAPEKVLASYPHELSGGMRQRVLIAMAFLSEPNLLIADEPGTALDVTTEAKVLDLLNELVEETDVTVLYITHDLGVARDVSQHINVMYAGNIVERAPSHELFESPQHPYTVGLIDSIPKLSERMGPGVEGQLPSYIDPPTACRFADRCQYAEDACREVYPYSRRTTEDHSVSCHIYDGEPTYERDRPLHERHSIDIPGGPEPETVVHGDE